MNPSRPDRPDWRWLEDTYWYVLPENLAALHAGGFSFEMAMSSGNMDRTAHWAYMAQTSPDKPSWASLPGVRISVPEMLDGIEPPRFAVP
jgi:hypothetical protein